MLLRTRIMMKRSFNSKGYSSPNIQQMRRGNDSFRGCAGFKDYSQKMKL